MKHGYSALRHFSNTLRPSPVAGNPTGSFLMDDEFLPDFEKQELDYQVKLESTISVSKKPDDMLKHGEEHGGILYKYDLPVVNQPINFRSQQVALLNEKEGAATAVENLLEKLSVGRDTSYESFVIKMHQEFNNEVDMYGDIRKAGEVSLKVGAYAIILKVLFNLGFGVWHPDPLRDA